MKVYAIRRRGTDELHGIFWASSLADLWDAVDEMADPALFEFARLKGPSGIWGVGPNDYFNMRFRGDALWLPGGSLSDSVSLGDYAGDVIPNESEDGSRGKSRVKWTRFDFANEGVGLIARVRNELGEVSS